MPNVTTSVPLDLWNKAREMNIRWNEALIRGIKELIDEPYRETKGEEIEQESWKSKAMNIQRTMQGVIDGLNKELEDKNNERTN